MAGSLLPNPSLATHRCLSFKGSVPTIVRIRPAHAISVRASSANTSTTREYKNANDVKIALYQALEGVDRGIFGIKSAKKSEIEGLVEMLESKNPTPEPTTQLRDKVDGGWKLVYSTITILGSKRTKLGLRGFIDLGDFFQIINVSEEKAVNVIKFNARGFSMLSGQLKIVASYKISSKSRVDITLESSSITPDQVPRQGLCGDRRGKDGRPRKPMEALYCHSSRGVEKYSAAASLMGGRYNIFYSIWPDEHHVCATREYPRPTHWPTFQDTCCLTVYF